MPRVSLKVCRSFKALNKYVKTEAASQMRKFEKNAK